MLDEFSLLEQHAVDAAINADWENAVSLNKKVLSKDKKNIRGYLRLGFALIQLSKLEDAEVAYKKALKIQPKNQIATDNLERIKILKSRGGKKGQRREFKLDPSLFLEIVGKTKSVFLVKLGQKNILAHLTGGQKVLLTAKKRKIEIRTEAGEYVGSLPDDLSRNLYVLIKGGNEYSAHIKEVSLNKVVVFMREEKRGKKYQKYTSFPKNTLARMVPEEEGEIIEDEEEEKTPAGDVEHLAENLTAHEDKVYLPYSDEVEGDDNDEE